MPRTLTRTCALCGLRFTNSALLELHIREDHAQRNQQTAPEAQARFARVTADGGASLKERRLTDSGSTGGRRPVVLAPGEGRAYPMSRISARRCWPAVVVRLRTRGEPPGVRRRDRDSDAGGVPDVGQDPRATSCRLAAIDRLMTDD